VQFLILVRQQNTLQLNIEKLSQEKEVLAQQLLQKDAELTTSSRRTEAYLDQVRQELQQVQNDLRDEKAKSEELQNKLLISNQASIELEQQIRVLQSIADQVSHFKSLFDIDV